MATQTIRTIFQLRRDLAANWELHKNEIPAAGEPCFEIDTGIFKIGDGKTSYGQLKPISGVKLEADGKSIILENSVFKLAGFDATNVGATPRISKDGSLEWVMVPTVETVTALQTAMTALQGEVTGLKTNVGTLQSDIDELRAIVGSSGTGADTLLSRVEGLEKEVDTILHGLTPDDGKIDSLMELISYVDTHGQAAAKMASDIKTLQELVGSTSVNSQILEAIEGKVDKVDGMGLSSNDFTDSLLGKLEAIEDGAQVNVIESISVDGSILDVIDKSVEIPVAGLDRAGVVKSSTGANKVNVSKSGEMSVNKVSIHSVFVPIGDELILDGGSASKETPVYTTRIGNIGYDSISDAVNCADNGDVVTLQEDVNMGAGDNDHLVVNAENVTIDLGGKELTANGSNGAIKVEGGVTTLDGTGTVQGTLGSDKYSMAVWAENGTVVINDGIYKNETDESVRGTDLIYASGAGCIEINGGTFEAAKPEWTLNVKDADYKAGTANIIVKGGKFKNFDPANNKAEGAGTNFVAEGYKSVKEGDYYVVKPV